MHVLLKLWINKIAHECLGSQLGQFSRESVSNTRLNPNRGRLLISFNQYMLLKLTRSSIAIYSGVSLGDRECRAFRRWLFYSAVSMSSTLLLF